MEWPAAKLAEKLGVRWEGDGARVLRGVAALTDAGPEDVSFLSNPRYRAQAESTQAGAVIVGEETTDLAVPCRLLAKNPYATFARTLALFHPAPAGSGEVSDHASVDPSARLEAGVTVEPMAVVGANATVGRGTIIAAGAVVGAGVRIGQDCLLHPRVVLYPGVSLGDRVIVHAGAVVGSDGFGFAPEDGRYVKVPQVGTVEIEDDVEIGANVTVDRGALGCNHGSVEGTKIDNLVQIAHNVTVGPHSAMAAQTGIAGSTRIGAQATFAGQSGVAGHLTLGERVIVSGKTAVFKDLGDGAFVSGVPARDHRKWMRREAALNRIADLIDRVKRLEKATRQTEEDS